MDGPLTDASPDTDETMMGDMLLGSVGPGRPLREYKGVPRAEWLGPRRGEL